MNDRRSNGHAARTRRISLIWGCPLLIILAGEFFGFPPIVAAATVGTESADDPGAKVAANQLAWDYESWKAVEISVRQRITNHEEGLAGKIAWNTIDEHYIELKSGERFSDIKYLLDSAYRRRESHYFRGSRSATVNYSDNDENKQKNIMLNMKDFRNEDRNGRVAQPLPLLYSHVGRVPLHGALANAKYLGKDRVDGRSCDVFLFPAVKWSMVQDQVFSLDAESHVPVRVSAYKDQAGREKGEPLWAWTADKFETIQGHIIPVNSTQIEYNQDGKIARSRAIEIQSIKFDGDYPGTMFWPEPQPGVPTTDFEVKKAIDKAPSKQQTDFQRDRPKVAPAGQAIVATRPVGWATVVSRVMLCVGLVIIVAGIFAWYRLRP